MDINVLRSLITVAAFVTFLGIVWWAYAPVRRERFEQDGMLPFADEVTSQSFSNEWTGRQ